MTPANTADITAMAGLIREDDRAEFGASAYQKKAYEQAARKAGVYYGVSLKGSNQRPLGEGNKKRNRKMPSVRSKVEHIYCVVKCQFGYRKVRNRGIATNVAQVFVLLGLANLYVSRRDRGRAPPSFG